MNLYKFTLLIQVVEKEKNKIQLARNSIRRKIQNKFSAVLQNKKKNCRY